MHEHIEHDDDYTEHAARVERAWLDPHEQTGSDAETTPLIKGRVRLEDEPNSDGWRSWTATIPGMSARFFDTLPEAHQWATDAATYFNTKAA